MLGLVSVLGNSWFAFLERNSQRWSRRRVSQALILLPGANPRHSGIDNRKAQPS